MYLVCLHPNQPNFQRLEVPHLKTEMEELFRERKAVVKQAML